MNTTENPSHDLSADVIVIGTGAGGGISAEILAKSGLKVILVEEGWARRAALLLPLADGGVVGSPRGTSGHRI